jgi:hypothetical protein
MATGSSGTGDYPLSGIRCSSRSTVGYQGASTMLPVRVNGIHLLAGKVVLVLALGNRLYGTFLPRV